MMIVRVQHQAALSKMILLTMTWYDDVDDVLMMSMINKLMMNEYGDGDDYDCDEYDDANDVVVDEGNGNNII